MNVLCAQKSYHTLEEHKAGMRKHMKGWDSPHLEKLITATQPDAMLLSHIYQRQALPCIAALQRCVSACLLRGAVVHTGMCIPDTALGPRASGLFKHVCIPLQACMHMRLYCLLNFSAALRVRWPCVSSISLCL